MAPWWGLVISPDDGVSKALPFAATFRPLGADYLCNRIRVNVVVRRITYSSIETILKVLQLRRHENQESCHQAFPDDFVFSWCSTSVRLVSLVLLRDIFARFSIHKLNDRPYVCARASLPAD